MKKQYYFGKSHYILTSILAILFTGFGSSLFYYGCINPTPEVFAGQNMLGTIAGPIILIITYVIVVPGTYYTNIRWQVNKEVFLYTDFENLIDKFKAFYFSRKYNAYKIQLYTSQIASIRLGWQDVPMYPYGLIGHPIIFYITMKDGSQIEVDSLITKESITYCQAVAFLKEQGISIMDPYDLLPVIADPKLSVTKYIDSIEAKQRVKK